MQGCQNPHLDLVYFCGKTGSNWILKIPNLYADKSVQKLILIIGTIAYLCFAAVSLPLGLWLLFNAAMMTGRGLAIMTLALVALPSVIFLWRRNHHQKTLWGGALAILVLILAGFSVAIILTTPSGRPDSASRVQHRFTQQRKFPRYALTNLIPEAEQINLGFQVMPYLDQLLTVQQSREITPITLEIYKEMERDPDFHQLGSAMGWAYAELLGQPFDVGHYYLYVPESAPDEPLPAIVFLHGSAGNFKAYTWIWSHLAEEQGYVIIAPSFGFGNWRQPNGKEAVLRAIEDAASQVMLDRNQIYLAGLSNGGLGVSQLAAEHPDLFRGLVLISPVIDTTLVDTVNFQQAWENRPVLLISGRTDKRIPINYIQERIQNLRAGGIDLTTAIYKDDHFLFFSQAEGVLADVSNWLTEINKEP